MEELKLDLWTCDIGAPANSPAEFAELILGRIIGSWESGADIVVFPEFCWMGLERFIPNGEKLGGVADLFWNTLWPDIRPRLQRPGKAVVLGSAPFALGNGKHANRAPVISNGVVLHQDKIHLTPWEVDFAGGGPLRIWNFQGHKIAVLICLDVEVPEISAALRRSEIDLILVPSATENLLGVERVSRCADARAVELGCHVALCHLVGKSDSVLVDENVGQLAAFSPSQSSFSNIQRRNPGELFTGGFHRKSVVLDMKGLSIARTLPMETNPARVLSSPVVIEDFR